MKKLLILCTILVSACASPGKIYKIPNINLKDKFAKSIAQNFINRKVVNNINLHPLCSYPKPLNKRVFTLAYNLGISYSELAFHKWMENKNKKSVSWFILEEMQKGLTIIEYSECFSYSLTTEVFKHGFFSGAGDTIFRWKNREYDILDLTKFILAADEINDLGI